MSVNFRNENYQPVIQKLGQGSFSFNSNPGKIIDGAVYVHSYPTEEIAKDAVAFWEWEKTVSKVMGVVTALIAAAGFWTALSGTGRLISATILASHGALWSTAFVIAFPLGTVASMCFCAYYYAQYQLAKEELPVWLGHAQSIKANGDFADQVLGARTRFLSNNGADLTRRELNVVAYRILSDAEERSLVYDRLAYDPFDKSPPPTIQDVISKLNSLARAEAV